MFSSYFSLMVMSMMTASSIATSPLNLGIWILMIAFLSALLFSVSMSSWFGLLLFLIYIGGMLVMFSYFIAISPNHQIRLWPMTLFSILIFSMGMIYYKLILFLQIPMSTYKHMFQLSPLFSSYNTILLLILGMILFMALIMVVKISSHTSGPLRPFN